MVTNDRLKQIRRIFNMYGSDCDNCGLNEPIIMEIHHLRRIKKKVCSYTDLRDIIKGIVPREHFQILCPNCHRWADIEHGKNKSARFDFYQKEQTSIV